MMKKDLKEELFSSMAPISSNTMFEMANIYMTKRPYKEFVKDGVVDRYIKIKAGDQIRVVNGCFVDLQGNPPTHQVTVCMGNLYDTVLKLHLIDLKTQELSILSII